MIRRKVVRVGVCAASKAAYIGIYTARGRTKSQGSCIGIHTYIHYTVYTCLNEGKRKFS